MSKSQPAASARDSLESERTKLEHGRLAVIGAITSGLGHDLRNAIMPALLRLDTLTATASITDDTRRQLDEIRSSLSTLQGLASGLHLLASDAELTGAGPLDTELHRWWDDVEPLVYAATAAGTQVHCELPDTLPVVRAPPNLLAQILLALVLHARECMHGSELPKLRISAARTPKGAALTMEFSAHALPRQRLESGNQPTTEAVRAQSMSGLTLENLHVLLAEYGGKLTEVECTAHGGVFTIDLIAERDQGATIGDTRGARVELSDLRQRAVAHLVLSQRGYHTWTSENVSKPRDPPSVIVCDAKSVQRVLDSLWPNAQAADSPNLIVVGSSPVTPLRAANVTWIAPTQLGLLAGALP